MADKIKHNTKMIPSATIYRPWYSRTSHARDQPEAWGGRGITKETDFQRIPYSRSIGHSFSLKTKTKHFPRTTPSDKIYCIRFSGSLEVYTHLSRGQGAWRGQIQKLTARFSRSPLLLNNFSLVRIEDLIKICSKFDFI